MACATPCSYASCVAALPQRGFSRLVARLGSESGSTMTTTGTSSYFESCTHTRRVHAPQARWAPLFGREEERGRVSKGAHHPHERPYVILLVLSQALLAGAALGAGHKVVARLATRRRVAADLAVARLRAPTGHSGTTTSGTTSGTTTSRALHTGRACGTGTRPLGACALRKARCSGGCAPPRPPRRALAHLGVAVAVGQVVQDEDHE
eukprot:7154139-Prymnesium_polylepis.3